MAGGGALILISFLFGLLVGALLLVVLLALSRSNSNVGKFVNTSVCSNIATGA
jgi:hypothetical protein